MFKGIFHPKEYFTQKWTFICWKCTQPQAIQDVDELASSSEQISLLVQMKRLSVLLLEKAILWIEDSYFNEKQRFEVKIIFSLQKMLTDGLDVLVLKMAKCNKKRKYIYFFLITILSLPLNNSNLKQVWQVRLILFSLKSTSLLTFYLNWSLKHLQSPSSAFHQSTQSCHGPTYCYLITEFPQMPLFKGRDCRVS